MFSDFLRFWIIFTKSIIVTLNSEHSANFENCHRNPFNNCHVSFIHRVICNIFLKPEAFIHWQIKPWGQKPNVFYCHAIIPKRKNWHYPFHHLMPSWIRFEKLDFKFVIVIHMTLLLNAPASCQSSSRFVSCLNL